MTLVADQPIEQLLPDMEHFAALGALAYLKWTCPKCGERVLADEPNVYNALGYRHTEREDGAQCGAPYFGPMFGLAVLRPNVPLKEFLEKTKDLPPDVRERIALVLRRRPHDA